MKRAPKDAEETVRFLLEALRMTKHDVERVGGVYGSQSNVVRAIAFAERFLRENSGVRRDLEQKRKCNPDCPGDDTCEYNNVCMCGCKMEDHDIGSGHSPVSMHDHYCENSGEAKT